MGREIWAKAFAVVSMRKKGEAEYACLGMATLNNFSGLQGIEAVFSCLVPGSGMIRAGG